MRWKVHGERSIYESDWMSLRLVDIEVPDGPRFDHHVVRFPRAASGTVVVDPVRGVLLLWRHRFTTDTWGWEVPAGGIDDGETPEQAAARETLEETGWRAGALRPLLRFHPVNGSTDLVFHVFAADGATHVGEPTDRSEAERIEWVPVDRLRDEVRNGRVLDGLSLTALLYAFTFGPLAG
jgi:8-oxo-dGTP pyrophosphatase MutT (NUDIX family)